MRYSDVHSRFITSLWTLATVSLLFASLIPEARSAGRAPRRVPVQTPVTVVSAASYASTVASDSIAAAFGVRLATQTVVAADADPNTPGIQLPTELGGTTVEINGQRAGLFFVSPTQISSGLPGPITLTNTPTLAIASVGGVAAPASPAGSLNVAPDITLPNAQTNPVTVALRASNIPLNTTVQVRLTPPTGTPTSVQSSPLTGTVAASTATASLTLPAGQSLIYATASIDLTTSTAQLKPIFIEGERVRKVEVAASFGGASEVVYVTQSGRRVKME